MYENFMFVVNRRKKMRRITTTSTTVKKKFEDTVYTIIERVYSTRIDCTVMLGSP